MNYMSENELYNAIYSMHLQWFGAEDEGRTEDASEHKIRKSREEGKVAKSADLSAAMVIFSMIIVLIALDDYLITHIIAYVQYYFTIAMTPDIIYSAEIWKIFYGGLARIVLPLLIFAMFIAYISNILQVGFIFTTKPLKPDLKRIFPDVVKYWKKSIFSIEALYNLLKSLIKIIIIGFIAYVTIFVEIEKFMTGIFRPVSDFGAYIYMVLMRISLQISIIFFVLALGDYLFQRKQYLNSLKMSKQEIKEERKSLDGDPLVKNRLRQRMRAILTQNIAKNVSEADVLITNPTHYAIALLYKPQTMDAPMLTAKGQDYLALRMKELAQEKNIPIIENKVLARALYADIDIGEEISEKYYEAVIIILQKVYEMSEYKKEWV